MSTIDAIILGIIEGFTEFLPISSTAHITLASTAFGIPESDFLKTFMIAVQLGAILPVAYIYFNKYRSDMEVHSRILAAFLPTALIGFVLYKVIKNVFLGNIPLLLWTLGIGGVIIIAFEYFQGKNIQDTHPDIKTISYKQAFIIGCCQALAVVPGVSRSASTIIGGLALGLNRATIIEFTFLLAVPTMIAATGYDIVKNIELLNTSTIGILIVGFITSLIFAQLSISFLLSFIKKYSFTPFGIYRIALALVVTLILF
jgi:undecaprenyl-diphosphatase